VRRLTLTPTVLPASPPIVIERVLEDPVHDRIDVAEQVTD